MSYWLREQDYMQKTDEPLVSIVMVIKNVERFLAQAIESVLSQTIRDFEFIIVDFGSTDQSKEIAANYAANDSRIRLSEIPTCSYINAKIAASSLAKGRFIAIQDADDVSFPDRLKVEVDFLKMNPHVGLLGGGVQWIDAQDKYLETPCGYPTGDRELRMALKERNPFWHPTVLFLREAYVRVGGYRAAFTQSDDYDLFLRISDHYQCANLGREVLYYRIHPDQLSLRKKKDQILCALAAQAAAALRREGKPDLLNSAIGITPALLVEMGVSEATQNTSIAEGYSYWVKQLYSAGEYSAVTRAVAEMLQECGRQSAGPGLISEMHILSARASWKQEKIMPCTLSIARALRTRPRLLGRPVSRLLRGPDSVFGFLSRQFSHK